MAYFSLFNRFKKNRNIPWNLYLRKKVLLHSDQMLYRAGGNPGTPGSTGPAVLRELYSVSRWLSCDIEVRATALFFANRFMKIWNLPRDIRYIIDKRRKKRKWTFLTPTGLPGLLAWAIKWLIISPTIEYLQYFSLSNLKSVIRNPLFIFGFNNSWFKICLNLDI